MAHLSWQGLRLRTSSNVLQYRETKDLLEIPRVHLFFTGSFSYQVFCKEISPHVIPTLQKPSTLTYGAPHALQQHIWASAILSCPLEPLRSVSSMALPVSPLSKKQIGHEGCNLQGIEMAHGLLQLSAWYRIMACCEMDGYWFCNFNLYLAYLIVYDTHVIHALYKPLPDCAVCAALFLKACVYNSVRKACGAKWLTNE